MNGSENLASFARASPVNAHGVNEGMVQKQDRIIFLNQLTTSRLHSRFRI